MMPTTLPEGTAPATWRRAPLNFGALFFVVCMAIYLYAVHVGWSNTLLDHHGFRQTQTAISTYYMIGKPPKLAYETPVLGPPWEIPFEFPLYQWIVAGIVSILHTPLDQTGRFVSVAFFLLSFFPLYFILGKLRVSPDNRFLVLGLLAVTPEYLFWSRTFLMETHVLFLSASFLAVGWEYLDNPRLSYGVAGAVLGILAGMVKITTFSVFLGALLLVCAIHWLPALRSRATIFGLAHFIRVLVLLVVLPIIMTACWTGFADSYKNQNSFGGKCLTSANLRQWNFGKLEDRISLEKWQGVYNLASRGVSGYAMVGCFVALCLASAGWWIFRRRNRDAQLLSESIGQRWLAVAVCVTVYLSGPLVFFNLYFIHDYYYCANTLFLVGAMGMCLVTMQEMGPIGKTAGALLAMGVLAGSLYTYSGYYYPLLSQSHDDLVAICRKIDETTGPDDVLVTFGHDWNADIAYYGKRRAIAVPKWLPESLDQTIDRIAAIHDWDVGSLVIDRFEEKAFPPKTILRLMEDRGFHAHLLESEGNLDLYSLSRRGKGTTFNSGSHQVVTRR
jgi:hypothetical protein